jgi:hypothetical protein
MLRGKFVIFRGLLLGLFDPMFIHKLELSIFFVRPIQSRRRNQARDPELDQFGGERFHMIT